MIHWELAHLQFLSVVFFFQKWAKATSGDRSASPQLRSCVVALLSVPWDIKERKERWTSNSYRSCHASPLGDFIRVLESLCMCLFRTHRFDQPREFINPLSLKIKIFQATWRDSSGIRHGREWLTFLHLRYSEIFHTDRRTSLH